MSWENPAENSSAAIAFLKQFSHSLTEGTSIHDKKGNFIDANPRLCEILGYTPEEILELQIHDVIDTSSVKDKEMLKNHLNGAREEVEVIGKAKTGKKLHLLISVFPVTGKDGSTQGSLNVWNDISLRVEREKNAQLLKELEDIVAWISVQFINMPWPVIDQGITWLLGDLGTFLKLDQAIVFRLDISRNGHAEPINSWSSKSSQDAHSQQRIEPPAWIIQKVTAKERVSISIPDEPPKNTFMAAEQSSLQELGIKALACVPIVFQDEVVGFLWLDSTKMSFSWIEGIFDQLQLVGILIANALDRKKTGELLLASEEKYKKLAETAQDFLIVYNTSAKIIYANKIAIETSEYSEDELYKKTIWDFVAPRDVESARKDLVSLLTSLEGRTKLTEIELVAKSGRRIPVEINSTILSKAPDGYEILAICRDVSKRKELDKMRHDFVVMASHELKTPMVAILGSAEFLTQHFKGEMSERAFQLVQLIRRGSIRLRNLISELIDVSRIETDKFTLQVDIHDLVKIANESIQNLSYLLAECNHEVKTSFPNQLLTRVDVQRVDQVFTNLISNAIKNSPHGSRSLVTMEVAGSFIKVSVQDQGVGLTSEEMAQLFEKFTKIDRQNVGMNINIQGSGLGLFISRQIVESHGGKIWAESAGRDKGSTFSFTLPMK